MAIQVWDPFRDMLSLRDAMNRLFEESYVQPTSWNRGYAYAMPLDVEETEDGFSVKASLPGFKPEEINVTLTGDTLSIWAEHKDEQEQKNRNYLWRERQWGKVARSITFPVHVEGNQVHANFENGELILTVPKAEDVKPKQISISVDGQKQLGENTAPTYTEHAEQQVVA